MGVTRVEYKFNSRGIILLASAILLAILIFLYLSWLAFGQSFLPLLLHQDTFVLGVGVGTSMYPTIHPGDYLLIDTTPEDLKIGEIVVYYRNGELIGHRIIRIYGDTYILKGDNNPVIDLPAYKSQIVGEVEQIISDPLLKKVVDLWFEGKI